MSILKRGAKIVARAVAEEFSWRAGENVGRAIGSAIGDDLARSYRRWRKLPDPDPPRDDDKQKPETD